MDIKPLGSTPSRRGPAESFTGTVWQNPIVEAPAPARIRGAWVRFEPRARTAWHTHPLGQTLHVVFGVGRVQLWGGPVREIRPGDTVWIAPDEKHWHRALPGFTRCPTPKHRELMLRAIVDTVLMVSALGMITFVFAWALLKLTGRRAR